MTKKYLIVPGYSGEHFISAPKLMQLYGVKPKECVIYDEESGRHLGCDLSKLIRLEVSHSGNYELPAV